MTINHVWDSFNAIAIIEAKAIKYAALVVVGILVRFKILILAGQSFFCFRATKNYKHIHELVQFQR